MKVREAPLMQLCYFAGLDGEQQIGLHIATLLSKTGLQEYLIVYDPAIDKIMAFEKLYMNPDDPADFNMEGIVDPDILKEIGNFCNAEGLFDHLPEIHKDDEERESQDTD